MSGMLHLLEVNEDEPYGWTITSPQLPGFVFGRSTRAEVDNELDDALEFAGAPEVPRAVHVLRRFETPEGDEFMISVANDADKDARAEVARRLTGVMSDEPQRLDLLSKVPRLPTGEALFVAVVPTDRLGWVWEQLDERDGTATIVAAVGDEGGMIWSNSTGFATRSDDFEDPVTMEELGLTEDSLVGDLVTALESNSGKVLELTR